MHYMHGSPNDDDHDRDMQLPFKTADDCISSIATGFVPLMTQVSVDRPVAIAAKQTYIIADKFILSAYLSNIWQPPRISC